MRTSPTIDRWGITGSKRITVELRHKYVIIVVELRPLPYEGRIKQNFWFLRTDLVLFDEILPSKTILYFFQSSVRSSLPGVLSQHVFMDTSGTFGRALMDLGTTHSILLNDDEAESRVTADNRRVHPVAHAPGGKLLWQILETEGSCNIDKITTDSLQVKLKVCNVLRSDYELYTFQPIQL